MDLTIARVLMWQLVVGAVLAACLWGVFGGVAGYSAMLGSLVCVTPNGFLALRLIAPRRDPGAQDLMRAAWRGEIGKLALTVLFFTLGAFCRIHSYAAGGLFGPPDAQRTRTGNGQQQWQLKADTAN